MEQKRVSFKVAKAIKDAGYPQGKTKKCYIIRNWNTYNPIGTIVCIDDFPAHGWELNYYFADIPTYLDVWIWLWREKKIRILFDDDYVEIPGYSYCEFQKDYVDPEEAIEVAINYIVENDLIK